MHNLTAGNENLAATPRRSFGWAIPTLYRRSNEQRLVNFALEPETARPTPQQLDAQFTGIASLPSGFVGRRLALRECRGHLREKPCLYIHGYGGIGKSTLSTKLAEGHLRDGCQFIAFQGKVHREEIIKEVADDLVLQNDLESAGVLNNPGVSPEQKLTYCVENVLAKERYVLLFDNFEDNQDDDNAFFDGALGEALGAILRGVVGTSTRVIMTSRYAMQDAAIPAGLVGTHNLGEMSVSDVRVKMGRDDNLRAQSSEVRDAIRTRIGGHPKAIQDLAAVLANTPLTWEQVEEKLRGVEDELQRNFLLLDILYEYLEPAEQELLRRASVYTQPESITAMQMQVEGRVEELLPSLISRSLMQVGMDSDGVAVHFVHRVTAQFLAEHHLGDEERKEAAAVAAEYYEYEVTENEQDWGFWLVAREHLLAAANRPRAAQIANDLTEPLVILGHYDLIVQLNNETLVDPPDERTRANALHNLGIVHDAQGRYENALTEYEKSRGIKEGLEDHAGLAATVGAIANVYEKQGLCEKALHNYELALAAFQGPGDRRNRAGTLFQIGRIHQREGRGEAALQNYLDALTTFRALGDGTGVSMALLQIGIVRQEHGSDDEAMLCYAESLEVAREMGYSAGMAHALRHIGTVNKGQGRADVALCHGVRALLIFHRLGSPHASDVSGELRGLGEALGEDALEQRFKEEEAKIQARGIFPVLDSDGNEPEDAP